MKFPVRYTLIALSAALAIGIAAPSFADRMEPAERLERMTEQLNLTPEQVEKIKPIMEQHYQEMETFREARQAEREKTREQMQAMHEKHREDMKTVLNEEQLKQLDARNERRMERRKEHFGKGGEQCDHHKGGKNRY